MEESKIQITPEKFKSKVYEICPDFVVNEWNRSLLNDIFMYVNEDISVNLNPTKGILLWGGIGTGKSTLIKIIGEVLRLKGEGFKTVNCSYLANQFSANGIEALNESTYNETNKGLNPVNRAFDEFGREPIPAKHYGNELNVMQYVIQCRYEMRDIKTFLTTNMNPESIESVYGSYIADRIDEMFNVIEMKGYSFRK